MVTPDPRTGGTSRRLTLPLLVALLAASCSTEDQADLSRAAQGAGLEPQAFIYRTTPFRRTVWHHVKARLDDPRIGVRATSPDDFHGAAVTTSQAAASLGAAVAINANWFGNGCGGPCGLAVGNGTAWTNGGAVDDDLYSFVAFSADKRVHLNPVGVTEPWRPEWKNVVSGDPGLFILRDGVALRACSGEDPSLSPDFTARSAVGFSRDGREIFLAVAPMANATEGAEFCDLGEFMKQLGAWNAMALDGGGSSSLVVNGTRVTPWKYTEGHERPVMSHLMLLFDPGGGFGVPPASPEVTLGPDLQPITGPLFAQLGAPRRLLDTRARPTPLQPGADERFDLAGALPPGSQGAVLNLTVTQPRSDGYLVAYSGARPSTSSVNFAAGHDVAGTAVVDVRGGTVSLVSSAATHAIVDLAATYGSSGSGLRTTEPFRVFDSRASGRMRAGETRIVSLPAPAGTTGAVLDAVVIAPAGPGWVTVNDCSPVTTSNLNFAAQETRANSVTTALAGSSVCVFSSAEADVVLDVFGWQLAAGGAALYLVSPARVLDTRPQVGLGEWKGMLAANQEIVLSRRSWPALPADTQAVLLTLTSADALQPGFLTAHRCGAGTNASVLNVGGGGAVANLLAVPVDDLGRLCLWTSTPTQLLVDVVGYYR